MTACIMAVDINGCCIYILVGIKNRSLCLSYLLSVLKLLVGDQKFVSFSQCRSMGLVQIDLTEFIECPVIDNFVFSDVTCLGCCGIFS